MRLTRGCNWSKISCKRRARGIGRGAEFESARKKLGRNLPPKGSIYGKCIEYIDLHGCLFSMVNLGPLITDGAPLGSENYRLSQLPPEICKKISLFSGAHECLNHNHHHPRFFGNPICSLHNSDWHSFYQPSSSMVSDQPSLKGVTSGV